MKNAGTLQRFFDECTRLGLKPPVVDASVMAPASVITVQRSQWRELAQAAKNAAMRWCGFWAQERDAGFEAFSCLETAGGYLIVRSRFNADETLPSLASVYPAADRPERHARDLLGLQLEDQPDDRRWTRHQAWDKTVYPLRADFQGKPPDKPTPPDHDYPFITGQGAGVVEIPVGPVHAGIIEPGHFRFQAIGEIVLNLEERLAYKHKGIEKLSVGRDAVSTARLAGRVSGDSTVSHAWAACQAMERAIGMEVPPRALWLRAIMAERERIANHMGDVGAICNDVGFGFGYYQLMRLKEQYLRMNMEVFGHRLMMDCIVPGGTAADIPAGAVRKLRDTVKPLFAEVAGIVATLEDSESLEDRLMGTGRLIPEYAAALGAVGYVGRASGQPFDVRRDAPYAPYDRLEVAVPAYRAGDVAARARVRTDEIRISLQLIAGLLDSLPGGSHRLEWPAPTGEREGIGFIEGWRGEIITYVRFDDGGRVARFFPRDPSWLIWPALELLIQDNIVPDFPVCNKSVNGSYSGVDL